jgi:DNA-binding NarL/FixJ family response regulator
MFTTAIVALQQQGDDAPTLAGESFNAMRRSGMIDSFVTAYRASPALLTLTRSVLEGEPDLTAELNAIVERAPNVLEKMHISDNRPLERLLTPRETEVYDLLAKGYSNREIATELFISEVTAKVHVRKILKKLGVRSRTEAVIHRFAPS